MFWPVTAKGELHFTLTTASRLSLYSLPPCAPEPNPDKQVCSYVENHGLGRTLLRQVECIVLPRLRSLQQQPWTIKTFFPTKDTEYASG